jgi:hypothetical protein
MQLKTVHLGRLAIGAVLLANPSAAIPYLVSPGRYVAGFDVQGAGGEAAAGILAAAEATQRVNAALCGALERLDAPLPQQGDFHSG